LLIEIFGGNARQASVYGEGHPDLISTEYTLAFALYASTDFGLARDAINRCLQIMRQGGQQARLWRHR
jgi:hypothetical protein